MCEKKSSLNFMSLVGFQVGFFEQFTVQQVLKLFSGGHNFVNPPVFGLF